MEEVKNRKILKRDWKRVEEFVNDEFDRRKNMQFRRDAEERWKEVDRQLAMKPMRRLDPTGKELPKSWHNAFELGELSKASEIITADVMRIMFPQDRVWFEPHVSEVEKIITAVGGTPPTTPDAAQVRADGVLRSLMGQQHIDFGLKARVELSIKEALHHGSYVAYIRTQTEMMAYGGKIGSLSSPVWVPYSMWNAFPDPSPSVVPTGLFYTGSMMLVEYMPLWKLKQMKGDGWMLANIAKVKKEEHKDKDNETQDVKLVTYCGDVNIERGDGDIYLPNSKVICANGVIVYYSENELPFPTVIYDGYERQDIRDPYHISPIIKQSPMQKFTTIASNKFADGIALHTEPPIEFDGNDPDYVMNGGPIIAPGAKTATRSMGKGMKTLEIGNPEAALKGMEFGFRQMQEGTGVSSFRQGVQTSDRQTATEVMKVSQGAEVRTVDFVAKLEQRGLRPFLYMQHALNRKRLRNYPFYNDEMSTPDFLRLSAKEVDFDAHFDVVGSRGVLGEEQRTQRVMQTTAFFAGSPLFAPKLRATEIMIQGYRDAGMKNPEQFVKVEESPQVPPEVQAQLQQAQQIIQQLGQELQEAKSGMQVKLAELELQKQKMAAEVMLKQREVEIKEQQAKDGKRTDAMHIVLDTEKAREEFKQEKERMENEMAIALEKINAEFAAKMAKIQADAEAQKIKLEEANRKIAERSKKRRIKAPSGNVYEIEDA